MGFASIIAGVAAGVVFVLDARCIHDGPAFWTILVISVLGAVAGTVLGVLGARQGQLGSGIAGALVCLLVLAVILHPFFTNA